MSSNIQAILFPRSHYSLEAALEWALNHEYYPIKYHITPHYIRLRLREPRRRDKHRIINLGNNIRAIVSIAR